MLRMRITVLTSGHRHSSYSCFYFYIFLCFLTTNIPYMVTRLNSFGLFKSNRYVYVYITRTRSRQYKNMTKKLTYYSDLQNLTMQKLLIMQISKKFILESFQQSQNGISRFKFVVMKIVKSQFDFFMDYVYKRTHRFRICV